MTRRLHGVYKDEIQVRPDQFFPFLLVDMRVSHLLSSALVLAVAYAADEAAAESDVLSLTASSFNTVVDPEPLILVEFFAPWSVYELTHVLHFAYSCSGVVTAKRSLRTMRRPRLRSRPRTSRSQRSTVSTRQTSANPTVSRVTRKHCPFAIRLSC